MPTNDNNTKITMTTNNSNSLKIKGFAAGILAAMFYGTNPLGSLPLYADGFNSASVLFYRYALAVAMFAIFMIVKKVPFTVKRGHLIRLACLGTIFAMSSTALYVAFLFMDAGIASTILFSYPIMVAVLMVVFFHERASWLTALSIALATTGIALLYRGDGTAKLSAAGLTLVIVSSLLYAIYIIAVQLAPSILIRNLHFLDSHLRTRRHHRLLSSPARASNSSIPHDSGHAPSNSPYCPPSYPSSS